MTGSVRRRGECYIGHANDRWLCLGGGGVGTGARRQRTLVFEVAGRDYSL